MDLEDLLAEPANHIRRHNTRIDYEDDIAANDDYEDEVDAWFSKPEDIAPPPPPPTPPPTTSSIPVVYSRHGRSDVEASAKWYLDPVSSISPIFGVKRVIDSDLPAQIRKRDQEIENTSRSRTHERTPRHGEAFIRSLRHHSN